MKRCPTCQRTFPDNAPDACPYDGTFVVSEGAQQQQYNPGAQPPPYGAPPAGDPSQWQQQQQPPGGYSPQQPGGYYQQPGAYPPQYGNPYAPTGGSKMLSSLGFLCGLGAFIILVLLVIFYALARNGAFDFDTLLTIAKILQPLSYLMLLAGVASIILGIISLVTAKSNPALSKPKAIIGMCLGAIPLFFFILGLAARSSM
jgi:hypothetical protein